MLGAVWASGTYDYEHTSGTFNNMNIGSVSNAWGGLTGADLTVISSPAAGALLVGILGGQTDTHISTALGTSTRSKAPTAGGYAAYILGDFSTDGSFTTSWIDSELTAPVVPPTGLITRTISSNFSGNVQYRFNFTNSWWFEPTAGLSFTQIDENIGIPDQKIDRWQAGARAGTSFMWGTTKVEETFTGLAYSDYSITGGFPFNAPPGSTDQGQTWGKGIAKVNFVWTQNFSGYVQGEIHGTNGVENIVGYVGTVGLRYVF